MDPIIFCTNYICISKNFIMNAMYIISIVLQLTAGLLLVGNTVITRKGIIKEYCCRNTGIAFNKDGTLADDYALKEAVKSSWINKLSFTYLFLGYLVSIFGEVPENRMKGLITILFLVVILSIATSKFANYKKQNFESIQLRDLPIEKGVKFVILDDTQNTIDEILEDNLKI